MKQTAIEWLIEQLADKGILHSADIAKAKAMEKEQIIEAYSNGVCNEDITSGQYYNETFKSE